MNRQFVIAINDDCRLFFSLSFVDVIVVVVFTRFFYLFVCLCLFLLQMVNYNLLFVLLL